MQFFSKTFDGQQRISELFK